ncbi:MAG: hypothetical protein AB2A00_00695 [Myxococcota bacterium]
MFRAGTLALAALCLMVLSVSVAGYQLKDGDSRLYAKIAHQLSEAPFSTWMSPQWPAEGYFKTGLFEEHLAPFFWPPALLGRLGMTADTAMLAVNFVYFLLIMAMLRRLTLRLYGEPAATLAPWLWPLSYAGFQFMVRGNHEVPLALGVLVSVDALLRAREGLRHVVLLCLATSWCFIIKGIVGPVVLPALLGWWWFHGRERRGLAALVVAGVAVCLTAVAHDLLFEAANGHSFLRTYLDIHLGYAKDREELSLVGKLRNASYYLGVCVVWFLPWSQLILHRLYARVRGRVTELDPALRSVLFTVVVYVLFFMLFDRRASRYVFSVYPLMAMSCAYLLHQLRPAFPARLRAPQWLMGTMLVLLWARIYFHTYHHSFYSWTGQNVNVKPAATSSEE